MLIFNSIFFRDIAYNRIPFTTKTLQSILAQLFRVITKQSVCSKAVPKYRHSQSHCRVCESTFTCRSPSYDAILDCILKKYTNSCSLLAFCMPTYLNFFYQQAGTKHQRCGHRNKHQITLSCATNLECRFEIKI